MTFKLGLFWAEPITPSSQVQGGTHLKLITSSGRSPSQVHHKLITSLGRSPSGSHGRNRA